MAKDDPAPKPPTQYVLGTDNLKTLLTGFLEAAKATGSHTPSAPGLPEAMTALLAQVEKLSQTAQRGSRQENPNYSDFSVFTIDPKCELCKAGGLHFVDDDPIGKKAHPRPTMIYEFEFCNALVRAEWLTIPEIELVNQFTNDKTARAGTWTASISREGTKRRLVVAVPYRGMDTRQDLPSLSAILVELLYGESIADPAQALVLIQQLQQKVNDLEARVATKV